MLRRCSRTSRCLTGRRRRVSHDIEQPPHLALELLKSFRGRQFIAQPGERARFGHATRHANRVVTGRFPPFDASGFCFVGGAIQPVELRGGTGKTVPGLHGAVFFHWHAILFQDADVCSLVPVFADLRGILDRGIVAAWRPTTFCRASHGEQSTTGDDGATLTRRSDGHVCGSMSESSGGRDGADGLSRPSPC